VATPRESIWSAQRWERLAPLSGLVAVVLFVVGFIVLEGNTPEDDVGAQAYLTYFQEEEGSLWVGGWIFSLGVLFFLWFLGSVRAALYGAEMGVGRLASTAYAGGVGVAILFLAAIGTQLSGAIAADESETLSPEAAEALFSAADGFVVAGTFLLGAFYLATAIIALRTRVLPLWLGVVTVILGIAAVIPFISWAVFIFATPVWIVIVSLWLAMRPRAAMT
jgi:hypothetical protein